MAKNSKVVLLFSGLVIGSFIAYSLFDSGTPAKKESILQPSTREKEKAETSRSSETIPTDPTEIAGYVESLPEDIRTSLESARKASIKGDFELVGEELHKVFSQRPEVVKLVVADNGFRNYRETDDFRKLLQIMELDPYETLGLPPLHLENSGTSQ